MHSSTWRLDKDLDLVLIDAACPFGGGHLLPRGLLREAPRQLCRAHAVLLTNGSRLTASERARLWEQVRRLSPRAVLAEAHHSPRPLWRLGTGVGESRSEPCTLTGRRVLALSSLGNPQGFEQMLAGLGAEVVTARYRDHHQYRHQELREEAKRAGIKGCAFIVTTEKDAVKIDPDWVGEVPVWVLPVELEFDAGQGELEALVDACVGQAA